MERITFKSELALGDHIVLLQVIESLHIQFPKKYITGLQIPQKELWRNHPAISAISKEARIITTHYPLVQKSNQIANTFADAYANYIGEQLNIPLTIQNNHANLYLTDAEKKKYKNIGKYWVVVCGGKADFTAKHLPRGHLQKVVDHWVGRITFVQPIKLEHIHYPLENVWKISDLNTRDLLSLVYNCEGVICPVTCFQHLAGAFGKPCICIGGGREPSTYIQPYPKQTYLHTVGMLSCCKEKACWKSRVVKLNDGREQDQSLCDKPIYFADQHIPACLGRITGDEIINIMERCV
jgi:ADP-heptose:LPS heptosyltransferase